MIITSLKRRKFNEIKFAKNFFLKSAELCSKIKSVKFIKFLLYKFLLKLTHNYFFFVFKKIKRNILK